jgi:hypothetical protein
VRRSSVRVPKVAADINWSSTALQRRSAIRIVSEGGVDVHTLGAGLLSATTARTKTTRK